jgi:exodeoxyribonuclease VII small subunit
MSAKNDSKSAKSLSEQLQELEDLIAWFEQEDIDLEEAIAKFDSGSKLAGEIKERLDKLENKITVLKQKFDS